MPVDPQALRARLAELNGNPRGAYNQGDAIAKATGQSAGMDGGACVGTCLDWLRRVVRNEAKAAYTDDESKTRRAMLAQSTMEGTAQRAYETRFTQAKGRIDTRAAERKGEISTRQTALRAEQKSLQSQYDAAWAAFERCTDSNQRRVLLARAQAFSPDLDRLAAEDKGLAAEYGHVQDLAQSLHNQLQQKESSRSFVHRKWPDFAGLMTGGKSFAGLSPLVSVPPGAFDTPGHLAVAVLQSPDFTAGRGVLLDVETAGSGPGHSLAGFHTSNGRYLLFDPNLGTYEFDQRGWARAVMMLYSEGYANCVRGDRSIRGCYTIFGNAERQPTVQPPMSTSVLSAAAAAAAPRP